MSTRLRWIATTLAALPLLLLWPTLAGLVASAAWVIFLAFSRVAAHGRMGSERSGLDRAVLVVCCLGFFLGGVYWVPAAAGFWLADRYDRQGSSNVGIARPSAWKTRS